ncbi:MAG TPA: hypothetical protein VID75_03545 [Acidimicrobiales bacterium]
MTKIASTVAANGDVNPYGIALVSETTGRLVAGDTLVSNFNSKANVQGTGTTIVQISPRGSAELFAQISQLPAGQTCPGGVGLTTALGVLPGGWVVVGSLPTTPNGALPSANPAGCLIVLNADGSPVETISNANVVGPWDMTVASTPTSASLFVSNALGGNTLTNNATPVAGNCTVVRIDLSLTPAGPPTLVRTTEVGTGFPWKANKAALVFAPTGLALGRNGTLYVDDTQTNTVTAIADAMTRTSALAFGSSTVSSGGSLNQPLGMTLAPNGDIIVVNGNDGNAVEFSPTGKQVATKTLVKNGAGDLFGLTVTPDGGGIEFVNDGTNVLDLYHPGTSA